MKVKKVPIIVVHNDKRKELVKQCFDSFKANKCGVDYVFYTAEDTVGNNTNYIWLRNQKAKEIDYDYDYIVFADDDVHFSKGWLKAMVKELKSNPDVWMLGAVAYHAHIVEEERENININEEVMPGICTIFTKEAWDKVGPWDEDKSKTTSMCRRIVDQGGKLAVMRDKELVAHCGIKSLINANGFGEQTEKNIREIANKVGAKTND